MYWLHFDHETPCLLNPIKNKKLFIVLFSQNKNEIYLQEQEFQQMTSEIYCQQQKTKKRRKYKRNEDNITEVEKT